jgi:hypothetical protein
MPTKAEARQAWSEAFSAYAEATARVLAKSQHEAHDLEVLEALAREVDRTLAAYRSARGERD